MKKFLLSIGLFSLVMVGKSQTVLNEIYVDPGNGHSEFFELYNSSTLPGGQSVDCFTILTFWESGSARGWYVLDLPAGSVPPKGFFVGAAATPFNTQSTTGSVANFSWNDPNFRNGSTGGSLKKYQINGSGYTDVTASIPADLNDLFSGGNGKDYVVLVYVNGVISNGFIGGTSGNTLAGSTVGTPLPPNLTVPSSCGNFIADFPNVGAVESVISQPGNDNGYARTSDGKCGAWVKTSSGVQHTPGVSNGSATTSGGGALTTVQSVSCATNPRFVLYDITAVTAPASEADDFAVEVQLYQDVNFDHALDGGDIFIRSKQILTVAAPSDTIQVKAPFQNGDYILVYKTKRGCFDKVVSLISGCASLPVSFSAFTATRSHDNVLVKWTTSSEQNNSGFAVERNINGTWEQVAFIPTQAQGGISATDLSYSFNDYNNTKGITQYRIKQIDVDSKSKYTDIRAVRGDGQGGKITVYPNPTTDGKVNIVFEDANVSRDVSVTDMSGRTVKMYRGITNNNITIDNLTPGMYSLRIVVPSTGDQSVEKIVVNKR